METERGKTALVTGATAGLGRALAEELAGRGYQVIATGRDEAALARLDAAAAFAVDLAAPGGARALCERVRETGLEVDVLVCNAGMGLMGPFLEQAPEALEALDNLNVTALTLLTRLFLPGMAARGRGRVVHIASTGAWQPGPWAAAYYASKSYVLSLSRALRQELRGTGVTVTAVCPGAVATRFSARAGRRDPKNAMDPRRVARAAVDGMEAGRGLVTPGLGNKCGHLASKLLPAPLAAWAVGRYQRALTRPGG